MVWWSLVDDRACTVPGSRFVDGRVGWGGHWECRCGWAINKEWEWFYGGWIPLEPLNILVQNTNQPLSLPLSTDSLPFRTIDCPPLLGSNGST